MKTIVDKLNHLIVTKTAIKNAIIDRGGEVSPTDTFRSYANKISNLPSEGGNPVYEDLYNEMTKNGTIWTRVFRGNTNITRFPSVNTNNVIDMEYAFDGCTELEYVPDLILPKVTNMSRMFMGCTKLTDIAIVHAPLAENMSSIFSNSEITNVRALDLTGATSISGIFNACKKLEELPIMDLVTVQNIQSAFYNCSALTEVVFQNTEGLTQANQLFSACVNLETIRGLNLRNVGTLSSSFANCNKLTNVEIAELRANINITAPTLTIGSMLYIIDNAQNVTNRTMTFGSTNIAKLEPEHIASAIEKGWTLN